MPCYRRLQYPSAVSGFRFEVGPQEYDVRFFFIESTVTAQNTAVCWDLDDMRLAAAHNPPPESYLLYAEARELFHRHNSPYHRGLRGLVYTMLKSAYRALNPAPGREYYRFVDGAYQYDSRADGGLLIVLK